MHAVFVIPGTMGTELHLSPSGGEKPETVWPPTALETQFGYERREKLASNLVVPGKIIESVLCFDFYGPLFSCLNDFGFTEDGHEKRLIPFPYDWRQDLFKTTDALADAIDTAHREGASRISLVAHSMGGLIARLLLEDLKWRDRPWFKAIDQFIAIATPHLGAPLALGRVLGVDSALGISGEDFAWLASREEFPSAYQLLPPPGEEVCWNQSDDSLASIDIYAAGPERLGLNAALLSRAKALHKVLAANSTPPGVRYFYFAATGHRTATRVNVFQSGAGAIDASRTGMTLTPDGGDGTVPLFSALPHVGQRHVATNEHATAFKGGAFRKVFVRLLGGYEGPALEAFALVKEDRIALSIEAPIVTAGAEIEVLLYSVPDADDAHGEFEEICGELVLRMVREGKTAVEAEVHRVPVTYSGPRISRLRLYLAPLDAPGHYQLSFEGKPGSAGPEAFAVCARLPQAVRTPGKTSS